MLNYLQRLISRFDRLTMMESSRLKEEEGCLPVMLRMFFCCFPVLQLLVPALGQGFGHLLLFTWLYNVVPYWVCTIYVSHSLSASS
jgi:hypothetical protein